MVALANLYPAEGQADDLDSYMFQTVGHQVLGAYAQCAGLPLYRRRLAGGSVNQVRPCELFAPNPAPSQTVSLSGCWKGIR